mmetsp:Transcript_110/g.380  ORF Transcript_110/g.380 Transcript_110/m.380 type:complete len:237 (+) Transcript_110:25-735(+)
MIMNRHGPLPATLMPQTSESGTGGYEARFRMPVTGNILLLLNLHLCHRQGDTLLLQDALHLNAVRPLCLCHGKVTPPRCLAESPLLPECSCVGPRNGVAAAAIGGAGGRQGLPGADLRGCLFHLWGRRHLQPICCKESKEGRLALLLLCQCLCDVAHRLLAPVEHLLHLLDRQVFHPLHVFFGGLLEAADYPADILRRRPNGSLLRLFSLRCPRRLGFPHISLHSVLLAHTHVYQL